MSPPCNYKKANAETLSCYSRRRDTQMNFLIFFTLLGLMSSTSSNQELMTDNRMTEHLLRQLYGVVRRIQLMRRQIIRVSVFALLVANFAKLNFITILLTQQWPTPCEMMKPIRSLNWTRTRVLLRSCQSEWLALADSMDNKDQDYSFSLPTMLRLKQKHF